ncbi:MAG: hypothetical protein AABZ47_03535 [Planctomycetota bacterium]
MSATPTESRCPECSLPVQNSLGPDVRPGSDWQNRKQLGLFRAWLATAAQALRYPSNFGRRLRLTPENPDHRRFLALHLLFVFFFATFGMVVAFVSIEGWGALYREPFFIYVVAPAMGWISIAGITVLTCLAATLAGVYYSLKAKRNLFPGAIQIACYQAPFVVAWIPVAFINFGLIAYLSKIRYLEELAITLRLPAPALAFLAWIIPSVTFWLIFIALVFRGTSTMKYANR